MSATEPAPASWLLPITLSADAAEETGVKVTAIVSLSESECLHLARVLMAALMELHRRKEAAQ